MRNKYKKTSKPLNEFNSIELKYLNKKQYKFLPSYSTQFNLIEAL